ncbi:MAG TPA: hypothetical protein VMA95_21345 [Streptosporangiaceae bacterium]|nr:hypothetical protein [Streptosporangiaceae bacterium]
MHAVFAIPLWQQSLIQATIAMIAAFLVCSLALYYFRRVRLERPPIGTFNARDITILLAIILALPFLYAVLPSWAITCFLVVTFACSLSIGYRQVIRSQTVLWLIIGVLIGANIYEGHRMMGTVLGWQVWWLELDILVIGGAVAVANLYIQGGMRLKHVAYFALALAAYDVFSSLVINVTAVLVEEFVGQPLDPTFGFRFGAVNYGIGIGDLLIYALFAVACYKAYGKAASRVAIVLAVLLGGAAPSLCPLVIELIDFRNDILIPSQLFFAPVAFVAYLWMKRRYGRERTMGEYLASSDNIAPDSASAPAPAREPVSV